MAPPNAEPACQAAEAHILNACRCLAAAGLSDAAIAAFIRSSVAALEPPATYDSAADAIAAHCVNVGLAETDTLDLLARLTLDIPGWPDLEEITAIIRHAYSESAE